MPFDNQLQEIKDRLNITEVLADYIQMKKAGTNFKAVCPFHSEKTPSFMVSPAKQIWHCFGCGLGGDIFEFIKQAENVDFKDAIKILADRAGVELRKPTQEEIKTSEKRHTLYDINSAAAKYFSKVLWETNAGQEALMYLKARGLTDPTIRNWQLGFAPDDFHYLENFLGKSFPKEDIEAAGLIVKKDPPSQSYGGQVTQTADKYFDRFRGRIMFPIMNLHGQVVGFTGRILKDQKDTAKYVNTPETPVYSKRKEIFGLYQAKNHIRKENRVVLVEGNMDVISSHQAGVNIAVASSGTALTGVWSESQLEPSQLNILRRLCDNLIFALDTDSAGFTATQRSFEEALRMGFNVKIANMQQAKDPDELIKKGIGLWKKAVETAYNYAEYLFERIIKNSDVNNVESKREVVKQLVPVIMVMTDYVTKNHFVRKLSRGIDIAEQGIWDIISKTENPKPQKPKKGLEKRKNRREILEDQLLGLSLTTKDFTHLKDFEKKDFSPENQEVYELLKAEGVIPVKEVEKSNPQLASKLEVLLFAQSVEESEQNWKPEAELLRIKAELKKIILKERMTEVTQQLKAAERAHDKELLAQLSGQFTKLTQEIQSYQ